jgi:hypothetical protein
MEIGSGLHKSVTMDDGTGSVIVGATDEILISNNGTFVSNLAELTSARENYIDAAQMKMKVGMEKRLGGHDIQRRGGQQDTAGDVQCLMRLHFQKQ